MDRSGSRSLLAILGSLILVLAACAGADGGGGDGDDGGGNGNGNGADNGSDTGETVSLAGARFSPSTLTIPVGTTVTFTDGATHTVTEGQNGVAVDDPIVDESWSGEPIVVAFEEAGTFNITCKVHPTMNMTVTVTE